MTELRKRRVARYGWKPDLPDPRDRLYGPRFMVADERTATPPPPSVDLRSQCPPVYDQGDVGSCTANAIAGAIQFQRRKQNAKPDFTPSRLFIYYNEREVEGSVGFDSGAMIRDGIKSVAKLGVCPETDWVYRPDAQLFTKPSAHAYKDALKYKVATYSKLISSAPVLVDCLANGFPFVFGFTVFESFESDEVAASGVVPMPDQFNEPILGGHAVMCVGYDAAARTFLCRNSWGAGWGMGGYFTMPYIYVTNNNLASDFWTIQLETTAVPRPTSGRSSWPAPRA